MRVGTVVCKMLMDLKRKVWAMNINGWSTGTERSIFKEIKIITKALKQSFCLFGFFYIWNNYKRPNNHLTGITHETLTGKIAEKWLYVTVGHNKIFTMQSWSCVLKKRHQNSTVNITKRTFKTGNPYFTHLKGPFDVNRCLYIDDSKHVYHKSSKPVVIWHPDFWRDLLMYSLLSDDEHGIRF